MSTSSPDLESRYPRLDTSKREAVMARVYVLPEARDNTRVGAESDYPGVTSEPLPGVELSLSNTATQTNESLEPPVRLTAEGDVIDSDTHQRRLDARQATAEAYVPLPEPGSKWYA